LEVVEADFLWRVFFRLIGSAEEAGAGLLSWGFDTENVTDLGSLAISSITEGTTTPKRVGPDKGAERSYRYIARDPELPYVIRNCCNFDAKTSCNIMEMQQN